MGNVNQFSTLWRLALRDMHIKIRGLRLLFICILLGVATLAGIGSLTSSIAAELAARGQNILGGDIEISLSQRQANNKELAEFTAYGRLSKTLRMRAMAFNPANEESALSELKAVDDNYPLYGALATHRAASDTPPQKGEIYIAQAMADRLSLNIGQKLRFGQADFTIKAIIKDEPDRLGEGFTLGPVAIINIDDIASTNLVQPGSLYSSKYRLQLSANNPGNTPNNDPQPDLENLTKSFEKKYSKQGFDFKNAGNGAPSTQRFIERMGQFLGLVGLAALTISGIGVGNGVSSYLAGKKSSIATLKILGLDSRGIFTIYLLQISIISIFAIITGLAIGIFAPFVITFFAGDILPVQPGVDIYPLPLIISAAFGALTALAFAIRPLSTAQLVPAARIFRSAVEDDLPTPKWAKWVNVAALILIAALAVLTAREKLFSAGFIIAALLVFAILWMLAIAIIKISASLPLPKNIVLRMAIKNLYRPGSNIKMLIVALGLGLTMFVTLAAIQSSINNEIANNVPKEAPNFFVLDIPKEKSGDFDALIKKNDAKAKVNLIPALRGSITEYKNIVVADLQELPEDAWVLRGDRGITYSQNIPEGSELTKGKWWDANYKGPPLVSMEEEVASILGLDIGDRIVVNILGVDFEAKIASLRKVTWDNFGLNYVLVFSPNTFVDAPHNMVATILVDKKAEGDLARAIPKNFPSATMIEVGDVITQITTLLGQMSTAIALAASIAILAGIAVLIGAISAQQSTRIYDSIVMKMLGATRAQILLAQAFEYLALALILSLLATIIGLAAAYMVVVQIFDFAFNPDPLLILLTLAMGGGVTLIIGLLGALPSLTVRPAQALRQL
ncbi:ABC transporter permease [Sphingorhabdus lutea]|uniref:ABC transporter permease n=2 Tax=Sphingorhabdus lutea TaxID=1913578 RepID=A0A1L3JDH6_9SPHN|nr:FtsX-like permease family protein [Sphingorhabdus lutea]APG63180.1 ABC transporter permease [Sphingorhabdus lutea]